MYKKILGLAVFVFALLLGQGSFADSSDCGKGMKDMIQSLNLTDDQQTKVKPILDQLKSTIADKASQMDSIRQQIGQQATSATMDQSAVDGLVDQKTKLIGDMMKAKIAATNQIMGILNDTQKAQLQKKIQEQEQKWADKFKKCHDED